MCEVRNGCSCDEGWLDLQYRSFKKKAGFFNMSSIKCGGSFEISMLNRTSSRSNKSIGLRIVAEISSEDTRAFGILSFRLTYTLSDVHTIVRSSSLIGIGIHLDYFSDFCHKDITSLCDFVIIVRR